jgi:RNA polymerase sigma factor (sigma-70 family)
MSSTEAIVSQMEALFLESLPTIDRLIAAQMRRHRAIAAEAEDYGAWAKARLIADDYAVLRKFNGRSAISTYLSVVLANMLRDYRNLRWGRWRPSAAALRFGPVGIRLEELLYRDRRPLREAVQLLRERDASLTDSALARMAAALPARSALAEVSLDSTPTAVAELAAPAYRDCHDAETLRTVEARLRESVAALPPDDAAILRMRYWGQLTVAAIARALQLDQKTLYRRIQRLESTLREQLEALGIDRTLWSDLAQDESEPP